MATLRNLAPALLRLAGITEVTRTLQRIAADRTRILPIIAAATSPNRLEITLPVHLPHRGYPTGMRERRPHRTRADYEQGLYDYHDPTAGIGGAAPTRSALTLRLVLAAFGLVFCAVAGWLAFVAGLAGLGVAMLVLAVIAAVDLGWIIHRKRRGEPG